MSIGLASLLLVALPLTLLKVFSPYLGRYGEQFHVAHTFIWNPLKTLLKALAAMKEVLLFMKTDRCVVRNKAYTRSSLSIRERHNERKNESYGNGDIDTSRVHLNVHYKQCDGTYTEVFDKMVADGSISLRGLKKDNPKIVDEMVFDVNTEYFDRNGGYEYAKDFFAEAYELAVKEAGGEEYILSAVMHADERNKKLSEELGRDIYHYHLHVVYVPVVDKEIKWLKRCKNQSLVGTVKERIKQVSHSKKWMSQKAVDELGNDIRNENGKAVLINSYSLL